MNTWIWRWVALLWLGMSLLMGGCGGGGSSGGPTTPPLPVIATAPAATTVLEGAAVSFGVAASGTGTLGYQWQRNGTDIAGATAATYSIASVTAQDNGAQFRVVVTDDVGSVASSAAVLTVTPASSAPTIVSQPVAVTVTAGTPATFRVVADGAAPLTYQWQRDGVDIAGATAASYTLASAVAGDDGARFGVRVANASGSTTSNAAALTIALSVDAPVIVTQPQSVSVEDGAAATLSVAATGTAPFSYQWSKGGAEVFGATANTLTTAPLALAESGASYTVAVTNGGGTVTSSAATVTVTARPLAWLAEPAATSVAAGQTARFTASASGSQPITWQWKRNGTDIAGATAASYTTPATTPADDGALYSVIATNPAGSLTSASARLTVAATAVAPAIATAPASLTVSVGQTATFSVGATGTAPLSYQWLRDGTAIAGATAASYTTAATALADNAARFSVRVTNGAGSITSAEAVLTVQAVTGPLDGRAWAAGQLLEVDDNLVRERFSGIDDAGRVTVVFRKSDGTRDVLYATRGTPNAAGTAPTWSAPVAIDVLAGAPVSTMPPGQPDYNVVVAPGGNALAYWYHQAPCSASTYNLFGTCRYYYMARYSAAADAWSAPELIGDLPAFGLKGVINDRGDVALFGTSWVRLGTNRFTAAPALFSRAASQATLSRQLVNAVPLGASILDIDAAGNLLLAAEAQQNATTDLVAYRGTAAGGLGAQQILDTRGDAATLLAARLGRNGQQVVLWRQSNGTATAVWSASSGTASGAWAVQELGALPVFADTTLTVADSGNALLANPYYRWRWGWVGGTWSALGDFPPDSPTWATLDCAHARNGNSLCTEPGRGRWASYDASRNVAVQGLTAYVLGVDTTNRGINYAPPLLSESGIGVVTLLNKYDVLPTAAAPAGEARTIANLWGVYLK